LLGDGSDCNNSIRIFLFSISFGIFLKPALPFSGTEGISSGMKQPEHEFDLSSLFHARCMVFCLCITLKRFALRSGSQFLGMFCAIYFVLSSPQFFLI
jgi:hypothetical protein